MSEITSAIINRSADSENFHALSESIRASFAKAVENETVLFTTDAENLYDIIRENVPENLKQIYACNTCRQFVNRFGGLVTISDEGDIHPVMWDDVPAYYEKAAKAIRRAVRKAKITGVFVTNLKRLGVPEAGGWKHLSVDMPAELIHRGRLANAEQRAAALAEEHRMLCENVSRYKPETVVTALSLLRAESLYRSEKVLGVAEWFHEVLTAVRSNPKSSAILWKKAATAPAGFCHVNGSMIGTLLDDIEAGYSFETVKQRFDAKMDPTKYQRPKAAPTAGNIARAEGIFEKLDLGDALQRRFARLDEIKKLWEPAAPVKKGLFSDLLSKAASSVPMTARSGLTMTWKKFERTVLPKAKKIEYYVPSSRAEYVAILTAAAADAAPILQWDTEENRNSFSWYLYNGGSLTRDWNISAGCTEVTAITLKPSMWNGGFEHHGMGVIFILKGAKDTRYKGAGCAIFPESLKSELHEVRSTIEAYSRIHDLLGYEEASACGLALFAGSKWNATFRVTDDLGTVTEYTLDRWD